MPLSLSLSFAHQISQRRLSWVCLDEFFEAGHKLVTEAHADEHLARVSHTRRQLAAQICVVGAVEKNGEGPTAGMDAGHAQRQQLPRLRRVNPANIDAGLDAETGCGRVAWVLHRVRNL